MLPEPSSASSPSDRQPGFVGANCTWTEQLTGVPEQLGTLVFVNSIPYVRTKEAGVLARFDNVTVCVEVDPSETVPKLVAEVCAVAGCASAHAKSPAARAVRPERT